jgi:hypothetical protein
MFFGDIDVLSNITDEIGMPSFCDLPEITEDALTQEMTGAGLTEPGPFYKQWKCIFGFVAQTSYVCVSPSLFISSPSRLCY